MSWLQCFLKVSCRNADKKEQLLNRNSYVTSLTVILDQEKLEDWFSTYVKGHILHPFLCSSVNMTTLLECFLYRYFGPDTHIHQFGLLNISIFSLNYANSLGDDESRLIYSIFNCVCCAVCIHYW